MKVCVPRVDLPSHFTRYFFHVNYWKECRRIIRPLLSTYLNILGNILKKIINAEQAASHYLKQCWSSFYYRRVTRPRSFNSLIPGSDLKSLVFKLISKVSWAFPACDLADDYSTLIQVMACCLTAASHYLNPHWSSSRPRWVNKPLPYIFKKNTYMFHMGMLINIISESCFFSIEFLTVWWRWWLDV